MLGCYVMCSDMQLLKVTSLAKNVGTDKAKGYIVHPRMHILLGVLLLVHHPAHFMSTTFSISFAKAAPNVNILLQT